MRVTVPSDEIEWRFIRSSGPGGQNVNKVASAVQIRWNIGNSTAISDAVKSRLRQLAGNKINNDDTLIIDAREQRSQAQNRRAALARLLQLVAMAHKKPAIRKSTKPSKAAKKRRLDQKRQRGQLKRLRSERFL